MAQQQVQQEAERIANLHELGAIQREYRTHIGYLLLGLILFYSIPFFLIVVTLIDIFKTALLPFLALAICIWTWGLVSWFRSIHRNRHSGTFLYTHGLLAVRCQGQQIMASEVIHWRDIAIIWHNVKRGNRGESSHSYRLQRSDGAFFGQSVDKERKQVKASIRGMYHGTVSRKLGEHIERMVHPYLWPLVLSTYEQGSPVEFGPLTLYTSGIQSPNSFLPWSGFERFAEDNFEGRLFIIPKKGRFAGLKQFWAYVPPVQGEAGAYLQPIHPWAVVPYAQIPNLALFLRLMESIRGNPSPL